jgi:hypothetical protein
MFQEQEQELVGGARQPGGFVTCSLDGRLELLAAWVGGLARQLELAAERLRQGLVTVDDWGLPSSPTQKRPMSCSRRVAKQYACVPSSRSDGR